MTSSATRKDRFGRVLGLSVALHAALLGVGTFTWEKHYHKPAVEIDLTRPVRVGPVTTTSKTVAIPKLPPTPPTPSPSDFAKTEMPAGPPTALPPGPSAPEGGATLSKLPQIKNLSELGPLLQRYYPDKERLLRQEGTVTVEISINEDGNVTQAAVVQSGGAGFDRAAIQVAKLLRFTPALRGVEKVGIRMRQTFAFKIES